MIRLLPVLMSLWLLVGLSGAQTHFHEHDHGSDSAHVHAVADFDVDHAIAHAKGAVDVDQEEPNSGARAKPGIDLIAISAAVVPPVQWLAEPLVFDVPQEVLGRGPPPRLRPPSQGPPTSLVFA